MNINTGANSTIFPRSGKEEAARTSFDVLVKSHRNVNLNLSVVNCGEASILREWYRLSMRSLTPQQAAGNAFATGFGTAS